MLLAALVVVVVGVVASSRPISAYISADLGAYVAQEHAHDAMSMDDWTTIPLCILSAFYVVLGSVLLSRSGRRLRVQLADPVRAE